MSPRPRFPLGSILALACAACSPAALLAADEPPEPVDEYATPRVSDPFEPVNRAMFKFNSGCNKVLFRPIARGYERVVPAPARRGLVNFFDNLRFPVRFVGCVLQGKPKRAGKEVGKLLVNTTAGLGGFVRVAETIPALAAVPEEDIGQTLGKWGIGNGPYLVLPFLGPSSFRDGAGILGNMLLNPVYSRPLHDAIHLDSAVRDISQVADITSRTPELLKLQDTLQAAAVDPYVAMRDGYIQYRDAAIAR